MADLERCSECDTPAPQCAACEEYHHPQCDAEGCAWRRRRDALEREFHGRAGREVESMLDRILTGEDRIRDLEVAVSLAQADAKTAHLQARELLGEQHCTGCRCGELRLR